MTDDLLKDYSTLTTLNGTLLFFYDETSANTFSSDARIPKGLARKILAFKDKKFEGLRNDLFNKTPKEIVKYVQTVLGTTDESIERLCGCIVERHIDGFVFYNYKDPKQFESDFADLNIPSLYFIKVILKRNEDFRSEPIQYTVQPPRCNKSLGDCYKEFLCSLLLLDDIQEGNYEQCKLMILYGASTNMNELEKKFVFFVVCREDDFTDNEAQKRLWVQIRRNTQEWLYLLPYKKRKLFTKSEQLGIYTYKGETIELSMQCKSAFVMEKSEEFISNFDIPILLISKRIFRDQNNCFVAGLAKNPTRERFCFSFKPSQTYFVFDPDDYQKGFVKEKILANQFQKKINTTEELNIQIPRDFKQQKNLYYVKYHQGKILAQPENDGTLSLRCVEFKCFVNCLAMAKGKRFIKFQMEALRFACGCLNARKNGTIYFGVADFKPHTVETDELKDNHKHGEIVGFEISEDCSDSRSKYIEALNDGILKCFNEDIKNTARQCISDPIFVQVVISGEKFFRWVMEVDVEPSYDLCKGRYFEVNLNKIGKDKAEFVLYLRKGPSTISLKKDERQLFLKVKLPETELERKKFEEEQSQLRCDKYEEALATKLERLLTRGSFRFDEPIWPILLLGKPDEEQKINDKLVENLSFIKRIQLTAVFDFDDFSNINGICDMHCNPRRSTICTGQLFHEKPRNINMQEISIKLGLSNQCKTVWIFANGKHDSSESEPHLCRVDWHIRYSAGVSNAVLFFNQNFVIPKEREIILVLLLSSDFDGVIDTFNEITSNFGLNSLVIIAEQHRIFDDFVDTIEREGKGSKESLKKVSVIGMPWNQVNSTITSLLGYNEKHSCVLPCSSGAYTNVEEKFVNTLSDLRILSATQCENKSFLNTHNRDQFAGKEETQFYKGQGVSWWNFFFENHVCSRDIYEKLHEQALLYLNHAKGEARRVVTLIIAHEPGAGATTLGHHLLWNFRKKFRCCIISKLLKTTVYQIILLLKYNEKERSELRPNPLVLLLDDIGEAELSISDFTRLLNIELRKEHCNHIDGMICLLLICQREETIYNIEYVSENVFCLQQRLSEREKIWFKKKSDELEETAKKLDIEDYDPQHLISFMIMRYGFNIVYIEKTIHKLLSDIEKTPNEYKLIKYVAFLSTYTQIPMRGIKVFIPFGCCDNLMGSLPSWDSRLSRALKVLLIFEVDDSDSGPKVRIAHPILGKKILCVIKDRENKELFDIAKEYLSCSLLERSSLGIERLEEFTTDMLIRRKKEESKSGEAQKFSPLIEEIKGVDPNTNYDKAVEILKLGFEKFQDPILAQALARLYSEWHNFAEAIIWAEEAVDLSTKQSLSFINHTYGLVLRDNFKHLTAKKTFEPPNVHEHLNLILKSLEVFLRAKNEQDGGRDTQKLLNLFEAIININQITAFLTQNIIYDTEKENVVRYLKDPHFVPEEIREIWGSFHRRLKGMRKQAEDAFKILEDNVCFYSIFSEEVLQSPSQSKKTDKFYKRFHFRYKYIHEHFSRIYGESGSRVPDGDQSEKDSYHRGMLWTLKGNSYMNIFNHIKNSDNSEVTATTGVLCEIEHHLEQIKSKDSNDLANQVCVKVALGIIGNSTGYSESNIIKTCKQIIEVKDEHVNLAHFFMSMLLWTDNNSPSQRRLPSLENSLSHLKKMFNERKYKQTVQKNESNFSQPRAQFYLGKGRGIQSLCHHSQIPLYRKKDSKFDYSVWEYNTTQEKLRRLYGTIQISQDGSMAIAYCMWDNKDSESIKISKIRGVNTRFLRNDRVSFYLGFSIAGPIAYNVKSARDESVHQRTLTHHELTSKTKQYSTKTEEELEHYLKTIKRLEGKHHDGLTENEVISLKRILKNYI